MLEMVLMQVALLGMLDSLVGVIVGLIGTVMQFLSLFIYVPLECVDVCCMGGFCALDITKWCCGIGSSLVGGCVEICMTFVDSCLGCLPF